MNGKRILLVICGGIAAYKILLLMRRLRDRGASLSVVMTQSAQEFVTPLSVGTLAEAQPYTSLFDLTQEHEIGHIRIARDCDLVLVAPATADMISKMANGMADDLASTVLLATDRPIFIAPAMNPVMWDHPATQRNVETLQADGVRLIGPEAGEMAERNEAGVGRMSEPDALLAAVEAHFDASPGPLKGKRAIVTAGPTHEPIDPVRYIANRSSGKQGYAIAETLASMGASVTLISGPTTLKTPLGITRVDVETARQMEAAVGEAIPTEIAVMTAAVADWRVDSQGAQKIKKVQGEPPQPLALVENPDILAGISALPEGHRPTLVIGFAAETDTVIEHAKAKLRRKGCDWIVANDVSPALNVMGGEMNEAHLITAEGTDHWPRASKHAIAAKLVDRIIEHFGS